jgi:hypothetical protein
MSFLVLRLFSTLKQRGRLLLEDYFMLCAVVLSDCIISALLAATAKGLNAGYKC